MENRAKFEREVKKEEEQKAVKVINPSEEELEGLKKIEKAQLDVKLIQKIVRLRGQIANQEIMIEKMRKENEKIKEKARSIAVNYRDTEYEMALRLSQMDASNGGQRGLSEMEIDVRSIQNMPMFDIDVDTPCCVCKKMIPKDFIVKSLPFCGHMAHQPCMDSWLSANRACPECSIPALGEQNIIS